jgi:pimeloyl-ACP methyl ester carboxylesterase
MKIWRLAMIAIVAISIAVSVGAQENAANDIETPSAALVGSWIGAINAGGASIHLVFNVSVVAGKASGTMDSPDQGVRGIPLSGVSVSGSTVVFSVASIGGGFSGTLSSDGKSIRGAWKQGAASLPLALVKSAAIATAPVRPQEPVPPFPYTSIDVSFLNSKAGIELSGTLTIPNGKGPFPGVILVTGSGPQNRDEEIFGHKPFLVIADYLTRNGIAVLRYDDRGVGASKGDFATATTFDLADDAETAFEYLAKRPEIDKARVGIVGHSEGGIIAPIVASRNSDVRFIVLLAGPGLRGDKLLLLQNEAIAKASGASAEAIAKANELNAQLYTIAEKQGDEAQIESEAKSTLSAAIDADTRLNAQQKESQKENIDQIVAQLVSPWTRTFLSLDPSVYLSKLSVPVLALDGSKDLQVPAGADLAAIAAALATSSSASYSLEKLDGLNHTFQHATTGLPAEYGTIEETFAPEALALMGEWIGQIQK